jgi:hypothetical protein
MQPLKRVIILGSDSNGKAFDSEYCWADVTIQLIQKRNVKKYKLIIILIPLKDKGNGPC